MKQLSEQDMMFFVENIKELTAHPAVMQMDRYIQHGTTSCLRHSVAVAYCSFCLCRKWKISCDERSLIRGAVLHDLFLYDWHESHAGHNLHGFSHPYIALRNAEKLFVLTKRERNSIVRHMWPLTPIPPRYRESMLVCLSDKICSIQETVGAVQRSLPALFSAVGLS